MSHYLPIEKWEEQVQLICKPEQSAKTFLMIQEIIKVVSHPDKKEIINIICCDNSLLQTCQTSKRVDKGLKTYLEHTYLELSSHKRTKYHDIDSVFRAILTENQRNIICCTNSTRMNDISELIELINESPYTKDKFTFRIYLDEADKWISFICNVLIPTLGKYDNVFLKCMTATPASLFHEFKNIKVLPLEFTTNPDYHGWLDYEESHINRIDKRGDYLEFINHVLTHIANDNILPGTKWFIPALTQKKTHEAVKELCLEKGMAVIIVNGDGMKLTLPNRQTHHQPKDDEVTCLLLKMFTDYHLDRYPVTITGDLCLGRGITIISPEFRIDFAIFSQTQDKDKASQLAGRVKGNIKEFSWYPQQLPIIYTTEEFDEVAKEWELKSRRLGRLAFELEQKGESTFIEEMEFKTCDKPYDYRLHPILFPTFEEARSFLQSKTNEMKTKINIPSNILYTSIHEREGYLVTSKLLPAGKKVEDLTKENRLTIDKSKLITVSRCISTTKQGARYLILPIYENMSSSPDTVLFQVRYLQFK